MILNKDSKWRSMDEASCALFCIVAALTGRSESSAHFWGLWQKGSSVQLSLLSWSVTTYRQTLVSDGFCSCTPFSLTDVTPVQSEAALRRKPLYDWKQEKQQRIAKKSILLSAAKKTEAANCKDVGGKEEDNVVTTVTLAESYTGLCLLSFLPPTLHRLSIFVIIFNKNSCQWLSPKLQCSLLKWHFSRSKNTGGQDRILYNHYLLYSSAHPF